MTARDEANEAALHGHFDVRAYGQLWFEVCPELGTVTLVGRATKTEVSFDADQLDTVIEALTSVRELLKETT